MAPQSVSEARARAQRLGFELSSDDRVGELLSVLAASVRAEGVVLELGTGAGVGIAWLAHGLASRRDVRVISVEKDGRLVAAVQDSIWPDFVELIHDDTVRFLKRGGKFDLIFADAQGGKWFGLDLSVRALAPNGSL